ncbi:MAG: nucleotide-binding protein [Dissulfurimicrobium sp.]|uniref:nucleotide-binding protein n=1 Tax=Dissulfurimicrobium sp. TaxID=2022436 RepID=UPI00404AA8C8
MTRTAAAVVLGCKTFEPELDLAYVILNQVAQRRHESVLRRAIEEEVGVPVLGALIRMKKRPASHAPPGRDTVRGIPRGPKGPGRTECAHKRLMLTPKPLWIWPKRPRA